VDDRRLIDRMKKSRGFKSPHAKKVTLTFTQINARYTDGEVITLETLACQTHDYSS
jgi:hypothetical protein